MGNRPSTDGEPNPLETLFADDDRPDAVNLDAVTAMNTEEFVGQLERLSEAADRIDDLATDAEKLRKTGLRDEDAKALLYGRNNSVRKSDLDDVFTALDDIADGTTGRDLFVRLVSDVAGIGIRDTRDILDELEILKDRYGPDDD